ncbi:MAG: hypothetical protein AAFX85_20225, partial [Pseudomonadota bacterium]
MRNPYISTTTPTTRLAGAIVLGAITTAVSADHHAGDDHSAILELMDDAFAAVTTGDPADWRPLLLDSARNLSFRPDADGTPLMRERSFQDMLARMGKSEDHYFERWLGEPTVMIRGP